MRSVAQALSLGLLALPLTAQIQADKDPRALVAAIETDGSNLFDVLAQTFDRVPMTATRVWYQVVPQDQGAPRIVRYAEHIAIQPKADATDLRRPADFALNLLSAGELGTAMTAGEVSLRTAEFRDQAGFLHYQRDFRVHDVQAARDNYRVVPVGSMVKNGRVGRLFDLLPREQGRSSYRILVDAETQVVLDWIEFDGEGRFSSAIGYEKVQLGALVQHPSSTQWWRPYIEVRHHDDIDQASSTLGFEVHVPVTLPRGYRLGSVRTSRERTLGIDYAVMVYTDGLRNFYLCESDRTSAGGQGDVAVGQQLVTVQRYRIGPVEQYLAEFGGRSYLLFGDFGEPVGEANKVPQMLRQVIR